MKRLKRIGYVGIPKQLPFIHPPPPRPPPQLTIPPPPTGATLPTYLPAPLSSTINHHKKYT